MPTKKAKSEVKTSRRDGDRRKDSKDRRKQEVAVVVERRQLERRAKVNRRRQIDPTTCEREYTEAEVEFMNAFNEYKRTSGRMFPTCSEVLEVLTRLGYRKEMPQIITAETAERAAASQLMQPPHDAPAPAAEDMDGEMDENDAEEGDEDSSAW
ncbi:MAG: hypothetical protein AB7O62_21015 [Pirellulales bacterium]